MRNVGAAALCTVAAAVFAAGQIAIAELAGITTLGGEFAAGNERVQGVQITLVAWYCMVAVALAVAIAGAALRAGVVARIAGAAAGGVGALAALPVVIGASGQYVRHDATWAVLVGALLGVAVGLIVAIVPRLGGGLAVYLALLWAVALGFTLTGVNTVVYAGMVEPLGVEVLTGLRSTLNWVPYDYHVPYMLPVAIAVPVLSGVLTATAARRGASWGESFWVGALGPVVSAVVYRFQAAQLYLWNEAAADIVLVVALLSLLVAAVTGWAFAARRATRQPAG